MLDPEQNSTFHDNYLDIDYDLSKVMFIATANNLNTISQPLLDRMELIEVSGYILEEKVEIAARHLVPKQLEAHGLSKGKVKLPKKTLQVIIESYTRESGVRELDKKIAKIMRKLARKVASDEAIPAQIKPEDLHEYLGAVEYSRDKYQGNDYAGVVTGLAWTAVGGEILFVEYRKHFSAQCYFAGHRQILPHLTLGESRDKRSDHSHTGTGIVMKQLFHPIETVVSLL
mgnify:CR=1 FL=1